MVEGFPGWDPGAAGLPPNRYFIPHGGAKDSVGWGVLLLFAGDAVLGFVLVFGSLGLDSVWPAAGSVVRWAGLLVGLTQVLWVVPTILGLRQRGLTKLAKGMTIGAGIMFLISGTCGALLLLNP